MRVLVVAATAAEISSLLAHFTRVGRMAPRVSRYKTAVHDVDVLVSGVGMVATATWCSRVLANDTFDVVLNLGVCGSFRESLAPGTVVHVVSDRITEMGAEDGDQFLTIQQMTLLGEDEFPFSGGRLVGSSSPRIGALGELPRVHGITVNTVHGNDASIERVRRRFDPDVESMEGAAFMYSCLVHGVPFAQIRAVSNIVERRNRDAWDIEGAIAALTAAAREFFEP